MEDAKLEAYYNELKAAAPKGGRGGLGTLKGPQSKKGGGFGALKGKSLSGKIASRTDSTNRAGENGLYSMFVKEGAGNYTTWEDDDYVKPPVDDRVGLIPCLAKAGGKGSTRRKPETKADPSTSCQGDMSTVPAAVWQKHCTAALKGKKGKTDKPKALRNEAVKLVLASGDIKGSDKAAVKAAWPGDSLVLARMLGGDFKVAEKSVTLVVSKKRKADGGGKAAKKAKKEKKLKASDLAADKTYKWKKHCAAVLVEAKKQQMKPEELQAAVVARVVGGKKAAEGAAAAGSPAAWEELVAKAVGLRVTVAALGDKFELTKKGLIKMK